MEQEHKQPPGHEPAGTDTDNERALKAASVGGLIGAFAGGRSGTVSAGLGALVGGTLGYAIGIATSGTPATATDNWPEEPIEIEVTATGGSTTNSSRPVDADEEKTTTDEAGESEQIEDADNPDESDEN